MTLNLYSPENADYERRRPALRAGLAALRPDLVALQETVWGEEYDQATDLLGPGYQLARHSRRSENGVGAVLASRWPLGAVSEIDLRVTDRVDLPWSAAVVAEVESPLGPLFFVHHKPTYQFGYSYERETQAVLCARMVEERFAGRRPHIVLAGDLDDTPDSASIRFWTGRQSLQQFSVAYRDAWETVHPDEPGYTFTPRNPLVREGTMPLETGRRIDYVMVRCGTHGPSLEVVDCRLAFDEPVGGVWATDHCGVVADLVLPQRHVGPGR
ncbi:endonuclease/exonuclease/phosphatase family protein [Actinoplanes sp. DH11]|uniref:endonuclease/exonuclease/phosphatase family protein n=1 Tax=Actinoplanes sp. DH11 TaxID=2857011 RepID=UPI001E3B3AD5|nr:endonuclease/exonuclease/phosphatase family protein [Actinoplanes sp. DH11]